MEELTYEFVPIEEHILLQSYRVALAEIDVHHAVVIDRILTSRIERDVTTTYITEYLY